jgi:heat shock protein HslJ
MPMRRVPILSTVCLSTLFAIAACGANDPRAVDPAPESPAAGAGAVPPDLVTHPWRLDVFATNAGAVADLPEPLLLRFDGARLSGNAPCNGFSATYELTGNTLKIGAIMATKRACATLSLESEYFQALTGVRTASVREGRLTLSGNAPDLVYVPAPAEGR